LAEPLAGLEGIYFFEQPGNWLAYLLLFFFVPAILWDPLSDQRHNLCD
jgi:hypothetical protein